MLGIPSWGFWRFKLTLGLVCGWGGVGRKPEELCHEICCHSFDLRWSQFRVFFKVKSLQEERQGLQKEVRCVIIKAPKLLASVPSHNWLNSRKIHNDKAWAKDYVEGQRLKGLNLDHAARVPPRGLDPQFNCTPSHASPLHNCTVSTRSDNISLSRENTFTIVHF